MTDDQKAHRAAIQRAYVARRRARGVCNTCGLNREPGNDGWVCHRPWCVARRTAWSRQRRQRKDAA